MNEFNISATFNIEYEISEMFKDVLRKEMDIFIIKDFTTLATHGTKFNRDEVLDQMFGIPEHPFNGCYDDRVVDSKIFVN